MERYAVVDLGSNTVRLVVYDVRPAKRSSDERELFSHIVNEKKTAGLATYVKEGVFTEEGIRKGIDVVGELLSIAKNVDADKTRIFATAVLRNCTNSKAAVGAIEDGIDKRIDVLSSEDEAHLGFVGASWMKPIGKGTLIDIGGGSTELTAIRADADHDNISLGQGSVSSYAAFVERILPTREEVVAIAEAFREKLEGLDRLEAYRAETLFGIGGSVRAVSKMCALLPKGKGKAKGVSRKAIDDLFALLWQDEPTFAHKAVQAVPDRLHSLMPGCTILRSCMEAFGADTLKVCRYGVREGYLLERMLRVQR